MLKPAVSFALLSVLSINPIPASTFVQASEPLVVMSFNIRYGTANDGENRWENRREAVFDLIRSEDPDLVGVQEALAFQLDELLAASPAYGIVGVGRSDGRREGEFAAILFRRDRFQVASSGTFWLSDTPEVVASKSWGNTIPRICTWARFVGRDGRAFWHYNVHLDHQSQPSRERAAGLLLERIAARPDLDEPVIITGDFNAGEDNPAMLRLTGESGGRLPRFVDSFRVVKPGEGDVGTFTGFEFGQTSGPKIDYVLVEPGMEVLDASIVRTSTNGRYPSDHFPVVARVRLPDDSGRRP